MYIVKEVYSSGAYNIVDQDSVKVGPINAKFLKQYSHEDFLRSLRYEHKLHVTLGPQGYKFCTVKRSNHLELRYDLIVYTEVHMCLE